MVSGLGGSALKPSALLFGFLELAQEAVRFRLQCEEWALLGSLCRLLALSSAEQGAEAGADQVKG